MKQEFYYMQKTYKIQKQNSTKFSGMLGEGKKWSEKI